MSWSQGSKERLFELGGEFINNTDVQLLLNVLHQSAAHMTENQQNRVLGLLESTLAPLALPKAA